MGMLDKFLDIMRLTADDDYDDEDYADYEEELMILKQAGYYKLRGND